MDTTISITVKDGQVSTMTPEEKSSFIKEITDSVMTQMKSVPTPSVPVATAGSVAQTGGVYATLGLVLLGVAQGFLQRDQTQRPVNAPPVFATGDDVKALSAKIDQVSGDLSKLTGRFDAYQATPAKK